MANEIQLAHTTGQALYFVVLNAAGKAWNGSGFETVETDNWGTYDVPMLEQDLSGLYFGDWPAAITGAGTYSVWIYERQGGTPASTDVVVGLDSYTVGYTQPSTDSWLTEADLTTYLDTLDGVTIPASFDLGPFVDAAVREWERRTGYVPFLSTGNSETRSFDPPGPHTTRPVRGGSRILRLGMGLLSHTSLTVGVDSSSTGTALTENSDYWLWPHDAAQRGVPYTAIEFMSPQWGLPRSIRIAGVWGYCTTIPSDAWLGCRALAASMALLSLRDNYAAGVIEWSEADVSERKSIEMLGKLGEAQLALGAKYLAEYTLQD